LAKKREEVNRLKALKMKEVRRKLEVISKEGGLRGVEGIEELDLEGEWDAGKHDETMKGLWGDEGGEGGEEV
jgi:protein KRI1